MNNQDISGDTPMHHAARRGEVELVRTIMKYPIYPPYLVYLRHTEIWILDLLLFFQNPNFNETHNLFLVRPNGPKRKLPILAKQILHFLKFGFSRDKTQAKQQACYWPLFMNVVAIFLSHKRTLLSQPTKSQLNHIKSYLLGLLAKIKCSICSY